MGISLVMMFVVTAKSPKPLTGQAQAPQKIIQTDVTGRTSITDCSSQIFAALIRRLG
jgi:hypothetical protein